MAIDCLLKAAPIAEIEVNTYYYTGVTHAICLRYPLLDLIIGNIPGAQRPNYCGGGEQTCAAVVTRTQAQKDIDIKPFMTNDVTAQTFVTKEELSKLHQEEKFEKIL